MVNKALPLVFEIISILMGRNPTINKNTKMLKTGSDAKEKLVILILSLLKI